MLQVHIGCDFANCEQRFEIVEEELHPIATGLLDGRGTVLFALSLVTLPPGWVAASPEPKVVCVYCANHRP